MTWQQFWDHVNEHYSRWPTLEILAFEVAIVAIAILAYRYLGARVQRLRQHVLLVAVGVFLLEFFTAPMWKNLNLGVWAYIYSDVTWIFTVAWTTMIIGTIYVVDRRAARLADWQRFALHLAILTPMALVFEAINVALGIRVYSPETLEAAGSLRIPILGVPAAGLYYVPVFMGLAVSFYRFWLPTLSAAAEAPRRVSFARRLVLTIVAVLMFEVIVEPMALNQGFPEWSYIFHDITLVMTGFWVVLITASTLVVDRLLPRVDLRLRFAAYLGILTAIAAPIEGWFIASGYRVYGPSATADFLGIRTIIGNLPVEVVAAIPIYLSLVIAFVRYWDGSVARGLALHPRPPGEARSVSVGTAAPQSAT